VVVVLILQQQCNDGERRIKHSYALKKHLEIVLCRLKLVNRNKKKIFQKFRHYKLSDKAEKMTFSALQTFGHYFVRKFVAPKVFGINVAAKTLLKKGKIIHPIMVGAEQPRKSCNGS